jgi:hypothetical protein
MRGSITPRGESAEDEASWEDRRKHKRKPVLWGARIATSDGDFDCIALNLSRGGAKLRMAEPLEVGQTATLVIDRFGALAAEVVWRRADLIGLRFTDAPAEIARVLGDSLPL